MKNQQGFSPVILLIAAAVVVIAGGLYFALTSTSDNNENANVVITGGNTNTETTNTAVRNNNATLTTNQSTNATANTNAGANTNADTTAETVTTAQVLAAPDAYDGEEICLTGPYQNSFEFTAFGSDFTYDPDGNLELEKPYIWLDTSLENEESLDCRTTDVGQEICTSTSAQACGTFEVAGEGEEGFGHVNAYRYQISQEPAESPQGEVPVTTL